MNTEQWEDRIIGYFEKELSEAASTELILHIKTDKSVAKLFNEYEALYNSIAADNEISPPATLNENFSDWLANEVTKNTRTKIISIPSWFKIVGVAASLFVAMFLWNNYIPSTLKDGSYVDATSNLSEINQQESPTERIKMIRVGMHDKSCDVDNKVIEVLLDVLHNDQSSNVRLAAVETLRSYTHKAIVREALIKSLNIEKDGFVKLALLDVIAKENSTQVKEVLEEIANDDSQQKFIIDEAYMQLIRLDKSKVY